MTGGLVQLEVYGSQDIFLTGSPQISFFKLVYRRNTNFAIQSVKQEFIGTTNFGYDMICVADKLGDLIYKCYLEITLPYVALNKNPSLYTQTQQNALLEYDRVNSYFQVLFNYVTADLDLTRKLLLLVRTNNVSMEDIILTMNDVTGFPALTLLIKYRNDLIAFITNSEAFNDTPELKAIQWDLLQYISKIDIKILFDSIVGLTSAALIGKSQAEIDMIQKQELLQLMTSDTGFYPLLRDYYLIGYDLRFKKENIYKSFLNKTYIERYKFAWVEEIGHVIIDRLDVKIGNEIIDKHTGDWMILWNQMTLDVRQKKNYEKMIGQIPELITFDDKVKPEYKLIIPLQFWFCRHSGTAIPLVALRYHDVVFELRLKDLEKCAYYQSDPALVDMDNVQNQYDINLQNVSLYIDYVYLDTYERRRFAQSTHEYLIETIQFNEFNDVFGISYNAECSFVNPGKFLFWFCQPLDYRENPNGTNKCQWNNFGVNIDKTGYTLNNSFIQLNTYERTDPQLGPTYYNYVDEYFHFKTSATDGMYNYSFSLNPMELQPSSTCNFSRIDSIGVRFDFSPEFINLIQNSTIPGMKDSAYLAIYTMTYNVLRIASGMGGLAFVTNT